MKLIPRPQMIQRVSLPAHLLLILCLVSNDVPMLRGLLAITVLFLFLVALMVISATNDIMSK